MDGTPFPLADTAANARPFGRARNRHRAGGYPLARVVALCAVGTHALLDWVARGYRRSEVELARRRLRRVPAGALLRADRNFHAYALGPQGRRGGSALLRRVPKGPPLPVTSVLPDGSYLSQVRPRRGPDQQGRGIVVRVLRYAWADDRGRRPESRPVTSLRDAARHPAAELLALYHRRREQELVSREVKGPLAGRPMPVRAQDPERVCPEVEALLPGHFTVRGVMLRAARQAGVPAVARSFAGSLLVLEARLARIPERPASPRGWRRWWQELRAEMGRRRLRPRRRRRCPRARKATRSHWPVKREQKEGTTPELEVVPPDP